MASRAIRTAGSSLSNRSNRTRVAVGLALALTLFCGLVPRAAHAESLDNDPDADIDRASGKRNARGRMDALDVDTFDLFPKIGNHMSPMVGVSLGYRFLPELTVGLYFAGAFFGATPAQNDPCHVSNDCFARDVRFGTFTQMHFAPTSFLDPWINLAVGASTYRQMGMDGSAMIGVDMRVTDQMSIGPLFTRTQSLAGAQPSFNAFGAHILLTF